MKKFYFKIEVGIILKILNIYYRLINYVIFEDYN